jgi:hypothetical protein
MAQVKESRALYGHGPYDAKLQVEMSSDELYSLKQAALTARITLRKYVRLKLGLDRESKEKK